MSEHQLQICRFCQRNVKLAYYCEDCGVSCCSDCLNEEKIESYFCQDCNSKNIEVSESGKKKICKDCGRDNISQINQLLKSCPKCHSHHVINIYEKKEELEKKFLELIKNARFFIDPFKEIVNSLYLLRQQVERARGPPIKCYHYPNMESDLLSLFKLFIYVKENLHEKISVLFHHLSLNRDYFFDIYMQPNSNVRIIEGILDNLKRSYDSINDFIINNVKTLSTSTESIQKNLQFIDKITVYFKSYKKFLNLADEEKPVYSIYAKLSNGLNTEDKYKKRKGILFITNFDLSFVYEHGRVKRKKETIFKAPVKDLTKIRVKGRLTKKLYIEFAYGKYEFSLPQNAISKVMDYILLARSFDEIVVYDEDAAKKLFEIDIDLSDLINYIEEAINSFFSIKCQYNNLNLNKGYNNNQINQIPQNVMVNQNQSPFYQNPNPYQNRIYPFNNSSLYQNNNYPPNIKNNVIQTPRDLRYYANSLGQYLPPNYDENNFFLQNFYNPNRIQNYEPIRYNELYPGQISDMEQKNILMRKLEHFQKYGQPVSYPSYRNTNDMFNNYQPYRYPTENVSRNKEVLYQSPSYRTYSKNHLSDLFDSDYSLPSEYPNRENYISKFDKEKRRNLLELEKERYSLEETLKTLDSKFEKGIISEIDYFRTYKNLQKDLYLVEKKLENIDLELKEATTIRRTNREFDRKRYFT